MIPSPVRPFEEMAAYVSYRPRGRTIGSALPFALIDKAQRRVICRYRLWPISTAFIISWKNWACTWLARQWQRSAINTEAKYLLLSPGL